MHVLAVGFWGAFFGTVALMLAGGLVAYAQSHRSVALAAGMTGVLSTVFVASYLRLLPLADPAREARIMAAAAIVSASLLRLMLLLDLRLLRERRRRSRILAAAAAIAAGGVVATWFVGPFEALVIGTTVTLALSADVLVRALRSALEGDRQAWLAVFALVCMLIAIAGLSWIAFAGTSVAWPVHAASAVAAMCYLCGIGAMVWSRYSYLLELREVLAQGPRYDPITRMPSNAAIVQLVAQKFQRQQHQGASRPVVLMAISVGNFYALENLHGRASLNHALFVCASRLRRCVPADVAMGRLFEDCFLLVSRNARDLDGLVRLGRTVAERLSRPVTLRTAAGDDGSEEGQAEWAAQVGVGLLATTGDAQPAVALATVRDMSRTAWSFASRVAWYDQASERIAEVPAVDSQR